MKHVRTIILFRLSCEFIRSLFLALRNNSYMYIRPIVLYYYYTVFVCTKPRLLLIVNIEHSCTYIHTPTHTHTHTHTYTHTHTHARLPRPPWCWEESAPRHQAARPEAIQIGRDDKRVCLLQPSHHHPLQQPETAVLKCQPQGKQRMGVFRSCA